MQVDGPVPSETRHDGRLLPTPLYHRPLPSSTAEGPRWQYGRSTGWTEGVRRDRGSLAQSNTESKSRQKIALSDLRESLEREFGYRLRPGRLEPGLPQNLGPGGKYPDTARNHEGDPTAKGGVWHPSTIRHVLQSIEVVLLATPDGSRLVSRPPRARARCWRTQPRSSGAGLRTWRTRSRCRR